VTSAILALMVDAVSSADLQVRLWYPIHTPTRLFVDFCVVAHIRGLFLVLFRDLGCLLLCRVYALGERS